MHWTRRMIQREFTEWAQLLDSLGRRPPGTWMKSALGGDALEDLDVADIEVLCDMARVEYNVLIAEHYRRMGYRY